MIMPLLYFALEPSKWINAIQDQDLKAGENVTIICKAEGVPSPQVSWVKKSGQFE